MNNLETKISMHNSEGWKGQYNRIKRWGNRLEQYNCKISDTNQLNDFLDTLYVTFQNIFHLKDWLIKDAGLDKKLLNTFIKQHTELGMCRDIANGTKHFTLDNSFSIDKYFLIMVMWNSMEKDDYWRERKIRIYSKAGLFDPFAIAKKCIGLWTIFLVENNLFLGNTDVSVDNLIVNSEYYGENKQTIFRSFLNKRVHRGK